MRMGRIENHIGLMQFLRSAGGEQDRAVLAFFKRLAIIDRHKRKRRKRYLKKQQQME